MKCLDGFYFSGVLRELSCESVSVTKVACFSIDGGRVC